MEIEKLAREAGIQDPEMYTGDPEDDSPWIADTADLERFAALVVEECARSLDATGNDHCAAAIRSLITQKR